MQNSCVNAGSQNIILKIQVLFKWKYFQVIDWFSNSNRIFIYKIFYYKNIFGGAFALNIESAYIINVFPFAIVHAGCGIYS